MHESCLLGTPGGARVWEALRCTSSKTGRQKEEEGRPRIGVIPSEAGLVDHCLNAGGSRFPQTYPEILLPSQAEGQPEAFGLAPGMPVIFATRDTTPKESLRLPPLMPFG
jgi:hypothetical protein